VTRARVLRVRWCAVLALAVALAGCTRVSTGTGAAGHPWTRHGVLRIISLGEPDTLNPVVGNQQVDTDLSMLWAGYFFNVDDSGAPVPELSPRCPR
jgi:hypothetical protein